MWHVICVQIKLLSLSIFKLILNILCKSFFILVNICPGSCCFPVMYWFAKSSMMYVYIYNYLKYFLKRRGMQVNIIHLKYTKIKLCTKTFVNTRICLFPSFGKFSISCQQNRFPRDYCKQAKYRCSSLRLRWSRFFSGINARSSCFYDRHRLHTLHITSTTFRDGICQFSRVEMVSWQTVSNLGNFSRM